MCRAMEGKRFSLLCSLETGLCNRTENGSSGKHNTWQEVRGALKLMEIPSASEKSEQGAGSRTRELRKGFLEEVASPSDLPNRLIYP